MANNLTLTNPVFDTAAAKFGSGALSGGFGLAASGLVSSTPFAFEGWVKISAAPGATKVALGNSAQFGWLGCDSSGKAQGFIGGSTGYRGFSGPSIIDGAWHHLAISTDGTFANTHMYVDGVAATQNATTGSTVIPAAGQFGVNADGNSGGSLNWPGEVDEAAVWSTNRYNAAFTPPTSAYTGSETGLVALYHLDSNGTDSSGAAPSPATTYTLTGPSSGTVSTASGAFTVQASGSLSAAVTVTPSDGGNGGTFSPTTVTLAAGNNSSATFTYTPASTGSKTISTTNSGSLTNPAALAYTSNASSGAIAPNNAAITYSPYNWLVTAGAAKSINSGAYLRTAFTGTSCALTFDTSALAGSYLPQIWYRIDGLYWQLARVASSVTLTMPTETASWPKHTLEVVVKATSEFQTRWTPQATAVVLTGITLASGATVSAAGGRSKNVLSLGDSITEGYHCINNNGSGADDVAGSDALTAWAFLQRDLLGAEVGVVGFGGTGLAASGQGGVPGLLTSYNLLWSGQARSFSPVPDLIVVNIGENDGSVASATFQTNYVTLLNNLISACPGSKIAALRPFSGKQASAIQAAVPQCSNPSLVTYIDTTGLFDTTLSVDAVHPLGIANVQTIGPSVATALRPILNPTTGGTSLPRFANTFH